MEGIKIFWQLDFSFKKTYRPFLGKCLFIRYKPCNRLSSFSNDETFALIYFGEKGRKLGFGFVDVVGFHDSLN